MPDETPVTETPVVSTPAAEPAPTGEAAQLEALRERLGIAKPPGDAVAKPDTGKPPPADDTAEEKALRALAFEQLRLAKESRRLREQGKAQEASRATDSARLQRLDAIDKAIKEGRRLDIIRSAYEGPMPDGELAQWAQELGTAMSDGGPRIAPEDIEALVDRKMAAKEAAVAAKKESEDGARVAVRSEANERYLTALDSTLRADPGKYPGLNRFGAEASKVLSIVEQSWKSSNGQTVLSVQDMLDKLESDIASDIAATPYGSRSTQIAAPAGAPQPAVQTATTAPGSVQPVLTMDEVERKARAEILAKAWELEKQKRV